MKLSARIILHAPLLRGVIMAYDPTHPVDERMWRPLGGGARGKDWVREGIREVFEEGGIRLDAKQVSRVNERVNRFGGRVILGYAEISPEEARWMYPSHPDQEDVCGFITYEHLLAGSYRGIPIHTGYLQSTLEACKLVPLAA